MCECWGVTTKVVLPLPLKDQAQVVRLVWCLRPLSHLANPFAVFLFKTLFLFQAADPNCACFYLLILVFCMGTTLHGHGAFPSASLWISLSVPPTWAPKRDPAAECHSLGPWPRHTSLWKDDWIPFLRLKFLLISSPFCVLFLTVSLSLLGSLQGCVWEFLPAGKLPSSHQLSWGMTSR